jgi:hypothetical protein
MSQYPANPMQAAAFLRHEAAPRVAGATRQISISFGEIVDLEQLRQAWRAVFDRHPILRSAFIKTGTGLMVREAEKGEPDWIALDWKSIPPEDIPTKWNELLVRDAGNEFEALAVPLFRWHAIMLPGGASHHLLSCPSYLLDDFSTTRILVDLLLTLGDARISPAGEMPVVLAAGAGAVAAPGSAALPGGAGARSAAERRSAGSETWSQEKYRYGAARNQAHGVARSTRVRASQRACRLRPRGAGARGVLVRGPGFVRGRHEPFGQPLGADVAAARL